MSEKLAAGSVNPNNMSGDILDHFLSVEAHTDTDPEKNDYFYHYKYNQSGQNYSPAEGNENSSPFSYNGAANTNFKNGIMIQFENPNGHTLNDYWAFKLQSWKLGTPASLLYTSSRYDGNLENMRGIITLKDVWDV